MSLCGGATLWFMVWSAIPWSLRSRLYAARNLEFQSSRTIILLNEMPKKGKRERERERSTGVPRRGSLVPGDRNLIPS